MDVYNTKGVIIMYPLAFFAIMLSILLNGYGCAAAAVLVKTNSTFRCDGRLDEYLLEDDLEFLMNPYVSRVLAESDPPKPQTGTTGNPSKAAISCGGGKDGPYKSCIHQPKQSPSNNGCVKRDNFYKCGGQPGQA
jgi:hypothetical protein